MTYYLNMFKKKAEKTAEKPPRMPGCPICLAPYCCPTHQRRV